MQAQAKFGLVYIHVCYHCIVMHLTKFDVHLVQLL